MALRKRGVTFYICFRKRGGVPTLEETMLKRCLNEKIVNDVNVNDALIKLRNSVNQKEIPKNKNRKKLILLKKSSTLINKKMTLFRLS